MTDLVLVLGWFLGAFAIGVTARARGLRSGLWFFAGLFGSPFLVLFLIATPIDRAELGRRRIERGDAVMCPACCEAASSSATRCPHCTGALSGS